MLVNISRKLASWEKSPRNQFKSSERLRG